MAVSVYVSLLTYEFAVHFPFRVVSRVPRMSLSPADHHGSNIRLQKQTVYWLDIKDSIHICHGGSRLHCCLPMVVVAGPVSRRPVTPSAIAAVHHVLVLVTFLPLSLSLSLSLSLYIYIYGAFYNGHSSLAVVIYLSQHNSIPAAISLVVQYIIASIFDRRDSIFSTEPCKKKPFDHRM